MKIVVLNLFLFSKFDSDFFKEPTIRPYFFLLKNLEHFLLKKREFNTIFAEF